MFTASIAVAQQQKLAVGTVNVPPGETSISPWKVTSYDGKWVLDGFLLRDNQTHEPVLPQFDTGGQVAHNGIAVSWSPDSQRFVLVDHSGKALVIYAAERKNDQWYYAQVANHDPQQPAMARVEGIQLGNWISPTELQITHRFLVEAAASGNQPAWQDCKETLVFDASGNVNFAAK